MQSIPNGCPMPLWLSQKFIHKNYYISAYKHKIYGIVFSVSNKLFTDNPIDWYDFSGQLIYRSLGLGHGPYSNDALLKQNTWQMSLTKLGECKPQIADNKQYCKIPKNLSNKIPNKKFMIYKHKNYGIIYAVPPNYSIDTSMLWYNANGDHLHTSLISGWGKPNQDQLLKEQKWNQSVQKLANCV